MTWKMASYLQQLTFLKKNSSKNSLSTTTAFYTSSSNLGYWAWALSALPWRKMFAETKYCIKKSSFFIITFKSADCITTGLKMTRLRITTNPRRYLCNNFLTVLTTYEKILNKNLSIASRVTRSFFFKSLSKAFVK